eukprot:2328418-Rhodomonas_salina.3
MRREAPVKQHGCQLQARHTPSSRRGRIAHSVIVGSPRINIDNLEPILQPVTTPDRDGEANESEDCARGSSGSGGGRRRRERASGRMKRRSISSSGTDTDICWTSCTRPSSTASWKALT